MDEIVNGIEGTARSQLLSRSSPENIPPNGMPKPTTLHTGSPSKIWKPVTLRATFMSALIIFTVAIIGLLEYLRVLSSGLNNGGLVFGESLDRVPPAMMWLATYMPTIVFVTYTMLWTWLELDIKRLEPWFRMSATDGATAEDSLFLHYPFDFGPVVPFKSFRRRHWAVFVCSCSTLLVSFVIVPLQAAIFTTGTIVRQGNVTMAVGGRLAPIDEQGELLRNNIFATAYGVSWLGQRLPPFTSSEFAVLPFSPREKLFEIGSNGSWTSTTQMYWANLTCRPSFGNTAVSVVDMESWSADDGQGCVVSNQSAASFRPNYDDNIIPTNPRQVPLVVFRDLRQCRGQSGGAVFQLLGRSSVPAMYRNRGPAFEFFDGPLLSYNCEPSYFERTVTVMVDSTTNKIIDVSYLGDPLELTSSTFNASHFENMVTAENLPVVGSNISTDDPVTHRLRLQQSGYEVLIDSTGEDAFVSNVVGNAIALCPQLYGALNTSSTDNVDSSLLVDAMAKSYALLFSLAANSIMIGSSGNETSSEQRIQGTISTSATAIIYVRIYAIVVEVCLAFVGLAAVWTFVYSRRRSNHLTADPGSIYEVMRYVSTSDRVLTLFRNCGAYSKAQLYQQLRGHYFVASLGYQNSHATTQLEIKPLLDDSGIRQGPYVAPDSIKAVRPWELGATSSVCAVVLLGSAIGVITYLYHLSSVNNGIERPAANPVTLAILVNALPILFASLLKPFWVIFNRFICAFQPYRVLQNNMAAADITIKARYTTVPPPLVIWRAVRARHFLLGLVCAATLSTNVLVVSLGSLITQKDIERRASISIDERYSGNIDSGHVMSGVLGEIGRGSGPLLRLNGERYYLERFIFNDQHYRLVANATGNAPLPAWVDYDHYYLPFDIPTDEDLLKSSNYTSVLGYTSVTRGFSFDVECSEIGMNGTTRVALDETIPNVFGDDDSAFGVIHETGNEVYVCGVQSDICLPRSSCYDGTPSTVPGVSNPISPPVGMAMEVYKPLRAASQNATPPYYFYQGPERAPDYCARYFIAGWGRIAPVDKVSSPFSQQPRTPPTTRFLLCEPTLKSELFNVTVSGQGSVMSARKLQESEMVDLTARHRYFLTDVTDIILLNRNDYLPFSWHNDSTIARDWMSAVIMAITGSNRLLDPAQPVPTSDEGIRLLRMAYKRLGAIYMAFDSGIFTELPQPTTKPLDIVYLERRILIEPTMFFLTVAILSFQLAVMAIYSACRQNKILARLPITIASTIADISASWATRNVGSTGDSSDLYGYGRFTGSDDVEYVGVEVADRVRPLK